MMQGDLRGGEERRKALKASTMIAESFKGQQSKMEELRMKLAKAKKRAEAAGKGKKGSRRRVCIEQVTSFVHHATLGGRRKRPLPILTLPFYRSVMTCQRLKRVR